MEIKKDIKNDLMARRELQIVLETEKTPSFAEISKMIADKLGVAEDMIMVENVKGKFGSKVFDVRASVYHSKELKDVAFKRLTKTKKSAGAEVAPAK